VVAQPARRPRDAEAGQGRAEADAGDADEEPTSLRRSRGREAGEAGEPVVREDVVVAGRCRRASDCRPRSTTSMRSRRRVRPRHPVRLGLGPPARRAAAPRPAADRLPLLRGGPRRAWSARYQQADAVTRAARVAGRRGNRGGREGLAAPTRPRSSRTLWRRAWHDPLPGDGPRRQPRRAAAAKRPEGRRVRGGRAAAVPRRRIDRSTRRGPRARSRGAGRAGARGAPPGATPAEPAGLRPAGRAGRGGDARPAPKPPKRRAPPKRAGARRGPGGSSGRRGTERRTTTRKAAPRPWRVRRRPAGPPPRPQSARRAASPDGQPVLEAAQRRTPRTRRARLDAVEAVAASGCRRPRGPPKRTTRKAATPTELARPPGSPGLPDRGRHRTVGQPAAKPATPVLARACPTRSCSWGRLGGQHPSPGPGRRPAGRRRRLSPPSRTTAGAAWSARNHRISTSSPPRGRATRSGSARTSTEPGTIRRLAIDLACCPSRRAGRHGRAGRMNEVARSRADPGGAAGGAPRSSCAPTTRCSCRRSGRAAPRAAGNGEIASDRGLLADLELADPRRRPLASRGAGPGWPWRTRAPRRSGFGASSSGRSSTCSPIPGRRLGPRGPPRHGDVPRPGLDAGGRRGRAATRGKAGSPASWPRALRPTGDAPDPADGAAGTTAKASPRIVAGPSLLIDLWRGLARDTSGLARRVGSVRDVALLEDLERAAASLRQRRGRA
jgi:hypothetical protein